MPKAMKEKFLRWTFIVIFAKNMLAEIPHATIKTKISMEA